MGALDEQVIDTPVANARAQSAQATALTRAVAVPSRSEAAWFRLRAARHIVWRGIRNLLNPKLKYALQANDLTSAPVLAEISSDLWRDGRADEFPLVAGKVENLRIAVRAFNGLEIGTDQILSFWQQMGAPRRRRGFVEGREIREGCVVPTIAGGLCQLSNALARAADLAGLTIIERHGHTARIEQADAPTGDATIFWNYLDLRLSAPFPFRIETALTADTLVVRIKAKAIVRSAPEFQTQSPTLQPLAARGCLTCDQVHCFRHKTYDHLPSQGRTAVLLNSWSPEFDTWLRTRQIDGDWFAPWLRKARRAAAWPDYDHPIYRPMLTGLRRTFLLRFNPSAGKRQAALIKADRWLAAAYAKRLKPHHTHLIIDQSLLVPLLRAGVLGGRTYDIFAPSLPAGDIQSRLDQALKASPAVESLNDFRVGPDYADSEVSGLKNAAKILTAHAQVSETMSQIGMNNVTLLPWDAPAPTTKAHRDTPSKPVIGFPASALPRKGIIELALAARRLGWSVLIGGRPDPSPLLWLGVDVRNMPMSDPEWLNSVDLVALPAHVEHAPRKLLEALSKGIPVVASAACGLPKTAGHIEIPAGDMTALIAACRAAMAPCPNNAHMVDAG
jgi:glycosyltransferase involved in cell wall biosynthesis